MSAPTDQTILFPERVDPATEHLHIRPMPERRPERASERRPEEEVVSEEIRIAEDALVSQVNQWIHEGNVRRIILKTEAGHTLIEIPLTAGIIGTAVGAVVSPEMVAVGVIGAMVARLTVVIERQHPRSNTLD